MIKKMLIPIFAFAAFGIVSCNDTETTEAHSDTLVTATPAPTQDIATLKSEIVAVETAWAEALNKKDIDALMALYADDAITMPPGGPIISGKENIRQKEQKDFIDSTSYKSIAFETLDVYGSGEVATEVGKSIMKDASGNTVGTGKYMAVFEKRDGKWLCIREIYNEDSK